LTNDAVYTGKMLLAETTGHIWPLEWIFRQLYRAAKLESAEVEGKASEIASLTVVAIKSLTVLYAQVGDPLYWND